MEPLNGEIVTMNNFMLNPQIHDIHTVLGEPDFETENFKYAPLKMVLPKTNGFIRGVLEIMREKCGDGLVDIKVHDLKVGEYPCKPAWHLDGHPVPKELSDYFICVFGETLTEFMTTQFECDKYDESKNPANYETVIIKSGHIYQYTSRNVHRCSLCKKDERRLLIRMTNANIKPLGHFVPRTFKKPKGELIGSGN